MLEQITTDRIVWHQSPAEAVERSGTIHVWCCDLNDPGLDPFYDDSALSDHEWHRAKRLHGDWQRRLFVRRRALGRFLLGQFLAVPPASLCFIETDSGKPSMAEIRGTCCEFSTSNSENVFVLAISETGDVGVDVEVIRPEWDWESVAAMYLDEHRIEQLKGFPERVQQKQFLRFWTLHEAFAKADGRGLTHKSDNNLSPSKVWDLIFEAKNFLSAFSRINWTWSQQVCRVGGNTAIVSATLH
jgi:4'-phosphopantetheinyl transferase